MGEANAILLISCPDQKGIIANVTEFVLANNGNVVSLDQHVDREKKIFFMRIEWEISDFRIPKDKIGEYFKTLVAEKFKMKWRLYFTDQTPKMAVFVTKLSHNLYDILGKWHSGEWKVDIPVVISNHEYLRPITEKFDIEFHHLPITKDNKAKQEEKQRKILQEHGVDFVVLARYMQVLSQDFIDSYRNKIINIHHSFLPAFPGAKPYHSAHERGVKIIGATSHYVTEDLDCGPIIEQDVIRVNHKNSIKDLIRKGQDLEQMVLSRAIYLHLQRRILVYDNKTIIFE